MTQPIKGVGIFADGTFRPSRREARALLSEILYQGPVPLAVTEALQAYNAVIAHPPTSAAELDAARHRLHHIKEHHHALSLRLHTDTLHSVSQTFSELQCCSASQIKT
jgi:hypothetical protein